MLLLLKLQAWACNFTKSNTPPWAFFTFFKFNKWYQIAQSVIYVFCSTTTEKFVIKELQGKNLALYDRGVNLCFSEYKLNKN